MAPFSPEPISAELAAGVATVTKWSRLHVQQVRAPALRLASPLPCSLAHRAVVFVFARKTPPPRLNAGEVSGHFRPSHDHGSTRHQVLDRTVPPARQMIAGRRIPTRSSERRRVFVLAGVQSPAGRRGLGGSRLGATDCGPRGSPLTR
jgi:hypothetical protein